MEVSSISYIVLLVLALYCLYTYYQSVGTDFLHFAYPTFIVVAANAAVGVYWEFTDGELRKVHRFLEFFQSSIVLPFLTTEVWLKHGVLQKEIAWIHAGVGLVLAAMYLTDQRVKDKLIDAVHSITAVSLGTVGVLNENYYAVGAAVLFAVAYFNFKRFNNCMDFNCQALFNGSMAGFVFCALRAIS